MHEQKKNRLISKNSDEDLPNERILQEMLHNTGSFVFFGPLKTYSSPKDMMDDFTCCSVLQYNPSSHLTYLWINSLRVYKN